MKALQEELIEFLIDVICSEETPRRLRIWAVSLRRSINSQAGNETPTVTDNEAEKEFCQMCGRLKVLKSEHLCSDCFDQIP